jgi:hypothetical protein
VVRGPSCASALAAGDQIVLEVEIENEAQRTQDRRALQVLLGGAEQHGLKAVGVQQTTQCVPKRVVIVDDRDDGP